MPVRQSSLPTNSVERSVGYATEESSVEEPKNENKSERAMSALNHAIQAIHLAGKFLPLGPAKAVLVTFASFLTLIKTTIQNKDDFIEISERCEKISRTLYRATSGRSQDETTPTVKDAIVALTNSMNTVMAEVQARVESGVGSRAFHVIIDRENVTKWQAELDNFLVLFNTELNLASNVKMDRVLSKFDELNDRLPSRFVNVEAAALVTVPLKPAIFVGREDIVQEAVQSLAERKHVALLGLGGMGKTFIAGAVLNEPTVIATFGQRRYFARYDDIDGSQITHGTFINRLATTIGLTGIRGKGIALIQMTLASQEPTLVVFDNAETFLDAEQDRGTIADSIHEIGSLTMSSLKIPPLDETPAVLLFKQIYTRQVDSQSLDQLLKSVDHHPLSINLLAQVAVQNEWAQEELVKAWEEQSSGLLETGLGKVQSLAGTISLSLKSPSLWKHRDIVTKVLPIIAFLPQGLNKITLNVMYPNLPQLQMIIDLLSKHSLTYFKGDFVTMVAPLRLHFTKNFDTLAQLPLLSEICQFYDSQLDKEPIDKDWFRTEDTNIEHMIAVLLQKALAANAIKDMISATSMASRYIIRLAELNPRPTSPRPIVNDLKIAELRLFSDYLNLKKFRRKHETIKSKGVVLFELGILAYALGSLEDSRRFILSARQLLKRTCTVPSTLFRHCSMSVAATYLTLGNYTDAQRVLEADFGKINIRWRPWNRSQLDYVVPLMMHFINIIAGRTQNAEQLFRLANNARDYGGDLWVSCASMTVMAARFLGQNEKAQKMVSDLLKESTQATRFERHLVAADFAVYGGNAKQAETYLDAEPPAADSNIDEIIAYHPLLAVSRALVGKKEEATSILQQWGNDSRLANNILARTSTVWVRGWIALHSGDLTLASASFESVLSLAEISSEMIMTVSGHRALGEIAFLSEDSTEAGARFKRVVNLCSSMGVLPSYILEHHWGYLRLNDKFEGWNTFSQNKHPFSKEIS